LDIRPVDSSSQVFAPLAAAKPLPTQPMLASTLEFGVAVKKEGVWDLIKALPFMVVEFFTRLIPTPLGLIIPCLSGLLIPSSFEIPRLSPPSLSAERMDFLAKHFERTTPSSTQLHLLNTFLVYHNFFTGKEVPGGSRSTIAIEEGPTLTYHPATTIYVGEGSTLTDSSNKQKKQRAKNLNNFIQFLKDSSPAKLENVRAKITTKYRSSRCLGPILVGYTQTKENWKTETLRRGWKSRKRFTIERELHSSDAVYMFSSFRASNQFLSLLVNSSV